EAIGALVALIEAPEIVGGAKFAYGIWQKSKAAAGKRGSERLTISDGNEGNQHIASINPVIVLQSTWHALTKVQSFTVDNDKDIEGGLNDDHKSRQAFASPYLKLDRPAIANSNEAAGPTGLGTSDFQSGEPLVFSLVKLYQAGRHFLPEMSGHYQRALASL